MKTTRSTMFKLKVLGFPLLLLALSFSLGLSAGQRHEKEMKKSAFLPVMTKNMDTGSDFGYLLSVAQNPNATPEEILKAANDTVLEIVLSNYQARAFGIASEIRANQPYLVGLQEVTRLQAPNNPVFCEDIPVECTDQLALLLYYLPEYEAVKVQPNVDEDFVFTIFGPPTLIRITDYDVLLVRKDVPASENFKIGMPHAQNYKNPFVAQLGGQSIEFLRGWISVDGSVRGKPFRFVTTHLESISPQVQAAETLQLLSGPLRTRLPTILVGDLNSDANAPSYLNGPAYPILRFAGFSDDWKLLYPSDPGLTWPLFAEDPLPPAPGTQPEADPFLRIDMILSRGRNISADKIWLTGTEQILFPDPIGLLFSSDHAGVNAIIELK